MKTPRWLPWFAVIALFALDRAAKHLALAGYHAGWNGFLEFSLFRNHGIAFSLPLAEAVFWPVALALLAVLVWLFIGSLYLDEPKAQIYLLIIAGAASNIIDRIQHGVVIDYLTFSGVFSTRGSINIADIMIVLGMLALVFRPKRVNPTPRTTPASGS